MKEKVYSPGDDLTDAFWVRDQVFTIEQGFSAEIEVDEIDPLAHHVVFYGEDKPFATARTFSKVLQSKNRADERTYIIGRVSISKEHRGGGTGKLLMDAIERIAKGLGAEQLELGAQLRAAGFYEKCGYQKTEHTYFEEYCEHVTMEKGAH